MSRPRYVLVAGAVFALVVTACGGTSDVEPPDEAAPPPTAQGDESEEPDSGSAEPEQDPEADEEDAPDEAAPDDEDTSAPEVTVFFTRAGASGIWVEPEIHVLDRPTEALARAALEIAFAGDPHDPGLASAGLDDVRILATNIRDRILIVDVSSEIEAHGTGSAGELAFAQQLAHTAAAFPTVDAVQLWVDGSPIEELWGHVDWSGPGEPSPFALSPITIVEPAAGPGETTVPTGTVTVRGEATVFEATFGIRLLGPDGAVLSEGFVTATEGAPGRGTWEHGFTIDAPGTYTIEAQEDDPSDGEGRPVFVTSRAIEVE